jgi:hypothetical protein
MCELRKKKLAMFEQVTQLTLRRIHRPAADEAKLLPESARLLLGQIQLRLGYSTEEEFETNSLQTIK